MITQHEVKQQLRKIGADFRFWGRGEANELEHVLVPGESITYCLNGRYEGGFAMLCVTDQRIILIDKKPLYLTLEDVRYDMVSEVDFSQRLIDATINVFTVNKNLRFTAIKVGRLRQAASYVQNRVMEFRQQPTSIADQRMQQIQTSFQHFSQPTQAHQYFMQPVIDSAVNSIEHRITNPYTKVPLMMRRRVSRFHSS